MATAASVLGARRDWFARNWKWVVPSGCLVVFLSVLVFTACIFFFVTSVMKQSEAYQTALARGRENPTLIAAIGTPMKEGRFTSGSTNVSGPSGQASLAIPLSGPKGDATIYVEATKSAGVWQFQTLVAQVKNTGQRIDLNKSARVP